MEGVPRGEALWILGDLFEYWIGSPSLADEGVTPVLQALRDRTRNGDFIGLIPGNRDFLIDAEFEAQTGVSVFPEGAILDGPEGPWLLVHGDEFCTLDLGYQRMRRVLRSKPFRFWVRHQPAFLSRAMARKLRRASKRSVPAKDPAEMAMQPDEVLRRAAAAGAGSVLCGHAHRFSDEPVPVSSSDGSSVRFMVLDAFGHGDRDVLSFARGESPRVHASAGA
jgi:UDP-2,3-diacylglucosamine hydrolase